MAHDSFRIFFRWRQRGCWLFIFAFFLLLKVKDGYLDLQHDVDVEDVEELYSADVGLEIQASVDVVILRG